MNFMLKINLNLYVLFPTFSSEILIKSLEEFPQFAQTISNIQLGNTTWQSGNYNDRTYRLLWVVRYISTSKEKITTVYWSFSYHHSQHDQWSCLQYFKSDGGDIWRPHVWCSELDTLRHAATTGGHSRYQRQPESWDRDGLISRLLQHF